MSHLLRTEFSVTENIRQQIPRDQENECFKGELSNFWWGAATAVNEHISANTSHQKLLVTPDIVRLKQQDK